MARAGIVRNQVWADSRIAFVAEPDGFETEFRTRSRLASRSPKVWSDAYLLTFAAVTGVKLVTFDRALRSGGADTLLLQEIIPTMLKLVPKRGLEPPLPCEN